jgi:hypothetical protein
MATTASPPSALMDSSLLDSATSRSHHDSWPELGRLSRHSSRAELDVPGEALPGIAARRDCCGGVVSFNGRRCNHHIMRCCQRQSLVFAARGFRRGARGNYLARHRRSVVERNGMCPTWNKAAWRVLSRVYFAQQVDREVLCR